MQTRRPPPTTPCKPGHVQLDLAHPITSLHLHSANPSTSTCTRKLHHMATSTRQTLSHPPRLCKTDYLLHLARHTTSISYIPTQTSPLRSCKPNHLHLADPTTSTWVLQNPHFANSTTYTSTLPTRPPIPTPCQFNHLHQSNLGWPLST